MQPNIGRRLSKIADERYFEDYHPGAVYEFGSAHLDPDEMIAFARRYDPQVFHIDPEGAKRTLFGGLIASGWYTAALMMRMYAEHYLPGAASLGAPQVDELRWVKPVRPGDELSVRVTVLEARRSRTKPDRGVVRSLVEVKNQRGELVMSMKPVNLVLCRDLSGGEVPEA